MSGRLPRGSLAWWIPRWRPRPLGATEGSTAIAATSPEGGRPYDHLPQRLGQGGGPRVQLVLCDSNRIFCEALASMLQTRGHRVLAIATTASDSIAAVATNRPDACVLDLRFSDSSGLDVARAIRQYVPETKILVFSCITDQAVVSETKDIGVTGFLSKGQKPEAIMDALELINVGRMVFDLGPAKPTHDAVAGGGIAPEAHTA
jgi:ActR/RegA family two-component response regulator